MQPSETSERPVPTASVIVCTRERPTGLVNAVASVLANTSSVFELVVVDQSATPIARAHLREHFDDPRLRYVHSETRGLSRARNVGIGETTGEVVIFTDDDCAVSPRWVETMVAHFADDSGLGAVVAPVVAEATWSDDGWTPTYEPAEELMIREPADMPISGMMGANMAFRRSALERIGGFDELLGPGAPLFSADDVDAVYRVVVAGVRAAVRLEPSVEHFGLRPRATGDDSRHLRLAYRSIGAYYGKHIRAFDVAALRNFLRQVFRTSTKAPTNAVRNRGQVRVCSPLQLCRGFVDGLQFPVDRRARMFVATPVAVAATAAATTAPYQVGELRHCQPRPAPEKIAV